MARPVLNIQIWSDIACPWCYVGKRRLDSALESIKDRADVKLEWHAFLLDPNFAEEGADIDAYGQKRFGPGFAAMKQNLISSGVPDGATFANWKWRSNTLKGHMLMAVAREQGKDHQAAEVLFQANYEEGKNLSEPQALLEAARKLGLEQEAVSRLGIPHHLRGLASPPAGLTTQQVGDVGESGLEGVDGGSCTADGVCTGAGSGNAEEAPGPRSGGGEEGVDGELLRAVHMDDAMAKSSAGESSQRYALSGAQPPDAFLEAFDKALAQTSSN